MDIYLFWDSVLKQKAEEIRRFFHPQACVKWHNTNEQFTVNEFIVANCDYPGEWDGEIERIEYINDLIITVTHVYSTNESLTFHVVSFIHIKECLIISIDEYWGEDDQAPKWRLDKHIGLKI